MASRRTSAPCDDIGTDCFVFCSDSNRAAFPIHHAIHSTRPDANAACHLHSLHGKAWCAFGRKLDMFCQDSCAFYGDQLGL